MRPETAGAEVQQATAEEVPGQTGTALFICSHGLYGLRTFGTVCFNFQIAAEPQLFQLSQLHRRRGRLQRQFQAFLATHHRQRAGAQRVLGEVGIRALRSTAGLHRRQTFLRCVPGRLCRRRDILQGIPGAS